MEFDTTKPYAMARYLYLLWKQEDDYRGWWRRMVEAYGETEVICLMECVLYVRNAGSKTDGIVINMTEDFLRAVGVVKAGR